MNHRIARMRSHGPNGFTIIELIIVIFVIALLATIVLVAYNGIQGSARDKSVLSDLDALDGIETDYGTKNNVPGLAWYSGSGTNSSLNFTPSPGDIIDVVTNSTDYCIRGYNPNAATYNTLATAAIKESTPGVCATIAASAAAIAASPAPPINNGGVVTTLAGSTPGYADGTGTAAKFAGPSGVAVDSSGNVYVSDSGNNRIRKTTSGGVVTTIAGSGVGGYLDGTGTAAKFYLPQGIAVDSSGNIYVADNNRIRAISPGGVVTTLAGSTPGYADGNGTAAQFWLPGGIAIDTNGNIYVADQYNNRIRKVTSAGVVTTLAGSGAYGYADGTGTAAQFSSPQGIAVDSSGNVYVTDSSRIRTITPAGVVTTLAGSGTYGNADGTGAAAQFSNPTAIAVDRSGNIYVTDNNRIRKITSGGVVTTLAGSSSGYADGTGTAAQFALASGVAVDSSGNLYVADKNNSRIRLVK